MIFRLKGHASFSDPRTEDMPNTVFQCDELLDQDSVDFQRQTQIGTGDLSSTSTIVTTKFNRRCREYGQTMQVFSID
jgi:hypothetical protein